MIFLSFKDAGGELCGEYAKGRRKSAEPDRRDALCGWYVCSGVSKSAKVWCGILSEELSDWQM